MGLSGQTVSDQHQLIEEYHDYVRYVAARVTHTLSLPRSLFEDLLAAGYLGLVEAASRYDPQAGVPFQSFAYLRIRGAIIDSLRRDSELSGQGYRFAKALEAAQDLREQVSFDNLSPSSDPDSRLAEVLELASKTVLAYRLSIDDLADDELPASTNSDPETDLSDKQQRKLILRFLATLPAKERLIIEQYYFHGKSFTEIADEVEGMSKSWVSRLHARGLERLRLRILKESEPDRDHPSVATPG